MNINDQFSRLDPDVLRERLIVLGEEWADANAAADLLEETKKTVLAELSRRFAIPGMSKAEREEIGLASTEYRDHVEQMVEARRKANIARVNYDAAKMWCEVARSVESTRRAEMSIR